MGDFNVRPIKSTSDRTKMYRSAISDIHAFEQMLQQKKFNSGAPKIGLEQELCIVDEQFEPATSALDILEQLNLPAYTNELALFNLEINSDPLPLEGACFSKAEKDLNQLIQKGQKKANELGHHLLLCGILPTLQYRHLQFEYMTPIQRYQVLSKMLAEIRGDRFEIYLQGVDELIMSLESVLFEACNTSFQMHLQIRPDEFVTKYNWSQLIAGPVLAACTNSPLLFGKELWAETRIALFKQSLDTRNSKNHLRKKLPRVYFGQNWLQDSPSTLWKNELMRFPLLLTSDDFQDAQEELKQGRTPNLRAIRLHNGTTYTWNRLCYGPQGAQPHLRIECRYIPAGPTTVDEIANFAFWVGLMEGQTKDQENFWHKMDFRPAKDNFIRAARTGLNSVFNWLGKEIPAKELILDTLLPIAERGLKKRKIDSADINKYLGIISQRVERMQTGTDWQVHSFRNCSKKRSKAMSLKALTQQMIRHQQDNTPVGQWPLLTCDAKATKEEVIGKPHLVEHLMSTDIFCVREEDSIELASQMMTWKKIHHLPVENYDGELVGILTDGGLSRYALDQSPSSLLVRDIMIKDVITGDAKDSLEKVASTLAKHKLSGLPITYENKLVGILTLKDLAAIRLMATTTTN